MHLNRTILIAAASCLMLAMATDARAKIPRKLVGKVFFTKERIKDVAEPALVGHFTGAKPRITLDRGKADRWKVNMVGFFRKNCALGPITIWLYDKSDKAALRAKQPVHILSVNNNSSKRTFVYDLEIDPNVGFNRKRTYLIQVGQLINKRARIYARGEVSLK